MGDVETREPQTWGQSVNSIADSLSLNFLFMLPRYQVIFQSKQAKEKLEIALVVFQFFTQKYYTWIQNNTFWCSIISAKKHIAAG